MRQLRIGRTAGSDNDTPMNPLPQTIRGRDERRDRCLSVLEICREFVSWREDRFAAIAAEIFFAKRYLPLLLIANERFGSFGLPDAVQPSKENS